VPLGIVDMSLFASIVRRFAGRVLTAACIALQALAGHAQNGSTPLIWEARSPSNTVYLFGTVHVGARKLYPLSPAVERAYSASRVLALEADPTDQSALLAATQRSTYTPPDSLAHHISPQLMSELKKALPAIGLPVEYAEVMRPELLAMTLAMMEVGRQGYDPSLGLDIHLALRAKQDGKRIVELESIAGQLALLTSFSPELQEAMLRSALDDIMSGSLSADIRDLVSAWRTGDEPRLWQLLNKEMEELPAAQARELREQLYDARNREMTEKIAVMLAGSEPTLVAVGVGHLLGDTGIVELLRKKGYTVRRL
jgi:uncharacterized protein YbaP (TraB family)